MSVLKIKNNDTFISIPTITGAQGPIGPQGPKGDKGDSGKDGTNVLVSTTVPIDNEVEVWINPTATSEVADMQNNIGALDNSITSISNRVTELENDIIEDSGLINFTMHNTDLFSSYDTYATPAFRVVNNIIYMQGLINVETESSNSSDEVCKMDAAYAPSTKRYFAAASSTNETNQGSGKALCLTLGTDGIIRVHACAIKGWLSLDGVAILRG